MAELLWRALSLWLISSLNPSGASGGVVEHRTGARLLLDAPSLDFVFLVLFWGLEITELLFSQFLSLVASIRS